MISQNFEQSQSHLNKLLEIIIKQHDAFRNQTGSFIDMIYFSENKSEKMKQLQKKINEVYLVSMNITKLLDKCKDEIRSINGNQQNSEQTQNQRMSKKSYKVNKEINKNIENMIKTTPTKPATIKKQIDFNNIVKSPQQSEYQHQPSSSTNLLMRKIEPLKTEQQPLDTNCLDFSMNMYEDMDVEEQNFQNDFKNEIFGIDSCKQKKEIDENSFILNQSYLQTKPLDQSIFEPQDFIKIKQEESHVFSNNDNSIFLDKYESFDKELKDKSYSSRYQSKYTTSSVNKKKNRNSQKRGHYNICPITVKQEAIRLARIKSIKEASEIMQIPEKNIKRWMKNGPERKKGAGRKTMDPIMEKQLLEWVAQKYRKTGQFPDNKEIKIQAKIFSNLDKFKASKGWCDKFLRRNYGYFEYLKNEKNLFEKI